LDALSGSAAGASDRGSSPRLGHPPAHLRSPSARAIRPRRAGCGGPGPALAAAMQGQPLGCDVPGPSPESGSIRPSLGRGQSPARRCLEAIARAPSRPYLLRRRTTKRCDITVRCSASEAIIAPREETSKDDRGSRANPRRLSSAGAEPHEMRLAFRRWGRRISAGFCPATYRGVCRLVQAPTTLSARSTPLWRQTGRPPRREEHSATYTCRSRSWPNRERCHAPAGARRRVLEVQTGPIRGRPLCSQSGNADLTG